MRLGCPGDGKVSKGQEEPWKEGICWWGLVSFLAWSQPPAWPTEMCA